ncbi:hypothetical protein GCM10007894_23180 [Paraferrimonas haliotis]|uniref:Uncharacterized protein n=1 Tax=Paraferrimonas haliotis TaxID=2013866 RepID=A0AA37U0H2_9GAMM|nr:hypothetical protein GCM10007894_23180 [Paraferrimonas haliotis]
MLELGFLILLGNTDLAFDTKKVEYRGKTAHLIDLAHSITHYSQKYYCECKKPARYLLLSQGRRTGFCQACWQKEELDSI